MPTRSPRPRKTVGRPTGAEAARIKQRILASATSEFLAHGYSGANVDRIARDSATGKPTIYRHFGDKQGLFETVCRQASAGLRSELEGLADDPRPPAVVLLEFARVLYDIQGHEVMTSLGRIAIFEAIRSPHVSEAVFRQAAETYRPIEVYLERQAAKGVLAVRDAALAAAQFGSLVNGGTRGFAITPETREREREQWLEASVRLFLDGMRPRQGS